MKITKRTFFKVLSVALFSLSAFSQKDVVKTDKGLIQGITKDGLVVFKGVPFAAPPVGYLRWKAPLEHEPWTGILQCNHFSASPIQSKPVPFACWSEEFIAPPEPLSEDCLYLNIWTKPNDLSHKKHVVMWIYGGGFVSGSAACDIYDGAYYAQNDVVFVSINYRVSIFGFLAHPELTAEDPSKASGNYAILDQIQALKWIQKNIAQFGGDPNNVTIMGQSAGSFSVQALVASPLAKGLFHKAIGHSGGLLGTARNQNLQDAENNGKKMLEKLNEGNIATLRKMDAKELFEKFIKAGGGRFGPVADGYVLPENLEKHFENHLHNDVPFISGWVTGDGSLGGNMKITSATYQENINKKYGKDAAAYLESFPGNTDSEAKLSMQKAGMIGFAVNTAMLWSSYNHSPSFIYEFDHVPTDKPDFPNYGAFHTADVPFALHNLHKWDRPWQENDKSIEIAMSNYWLNFIKTGNPNSIGQAEWKPFEPDSKSVFYLGETLNNKPGLYQKEISVLKP